MSFLTDERKKAFLGLLIPTSSGSIGSGNTKKPFPMNLSHSGMLLASYLRTLKLCLASSITRQKLLFVIAMQCSETRVHSNLAVALAVARLINEFQISEVVI